MGSIWAPSNQLLFYSVPFPSILSLLPASPELGERSIAYKGHTDRVVEKRFLYITMQLATALVPEESGRYLHSLHWVSLLQMISGSG